MSLIPDVTSNTPPTPHVETEGKFVLKKRTLFSELEDTKELPESDLCFQDDHAIYQFKFEKPELDKKEIVKPGTFKIEEVANKIILSKMEMRTRNLLTSVVNTQSIVEEANAFFNNLEVYDFLGEPKARKILIHSDPGMGKTATITQYSQHAIAEDPGTVVMVWPTSSIDAGDIADFMSTHSEYTPECTRLILIAEDIGGGEREGSQGVRGVDSAMLEFLDGIEVTFKLPTLIIATTNYPQNLLSALADRPGRFDLIMQLVPPTFGERIALLEWIAKRVLNDEEKLVFKRRECEDFSVAHLKEAVIRSMLHKKPLGVIVQQLIEHRARFRKGFEKDGKQMGFGDED